MKKLLLLSFLLVGCAQTQSFFTAHPNLAHATADLSSVALQLGESWVQNYAANAVEAKTQNAYLDSAAEMLRSTQTFNVSSAQLYKAITGGLGGQAGGNVLASNIVAAYNASTAPADVKKEQLAIGLQAASATAK